MIFLLGIILALGLSVWLWGQENVKTAIKWLLGLSIFIIFFIFVIDYIDKKASQEKEAELQKSYESAPEAPDANATLPIAPAENSQQNLLQLTEKNKQSYEFLLDLKETVDKRIQEDKYKNDEEKEADINAKKQLEIWVDNAKNKTQ